MPENLTKAQLDSLHTGTVVIAKDWEGNTILGIRNNRSAVGGNNVTYELYECFNVIDSDYFYNARILSQS